MNTKLLLYCTSFFCGMSIMAVELSASKLLAPYFGTSQVIWTVIIGLIMISLSIGNILGGRSADKHNSMNRLYFYIWIASLWVAVIPFVGKYIIAGITGLLVVFLPSNLLVTGSALSCLIIFSAPLVVLGMVSPYLVKLGVTDMYTSGKTAGQIYAMNTIGSIIGTFLPTFVTIPTIGTGKTFLVFSLVLNVICITYFILNKTKVIRVSVSLLIILGLCLFPFSNSYAFWKDNVIEDESLYNYLQVSEKDNTVYLSTNVAFGVQSVYKKDNNLSGFYYDYGLMAPMFIKDTTLNKKLDVLVLGMGTGTYAKQIKRYYPNTSTDGVEIDQKIVDLSKQYFDLKDEEANIYVTDGRTFLSDKECKTYDIIMVDAYHDITIPFHMATQEFFTEVSKHLKPGGVILMNINMKSKGDNPINQYLTQTVKSVMKKVYTCDIKSGTNMLVFASNDVNCVENYEHNISSVEVDDSGAYAKIAQYVKDNLKEVTKSELVFTDDWAPVDVLGQSLLNDMVQDELGFVKETIDKKGIKGLFELLE